MYCTHRKPLGLGSHKPKHLSLGALLHSLLQQSLQGLSGAVVLLKVGCLEPDVPLLGEGGEGMGIDGPGTLTGLMSSTLREG